LPSRPEIVATTLRLPAGHEWTIPLSEIEKAFPEFENGQKALDWLNHLLARRGGSQGKITNGNAVFRRQNA
jgi:hypothetical protein